MRHTSRTILWVHLIGPVTGPDVPGRQARTLLALLAVHHPDLVAADRLIEALWSDHPPHRPERAIAGYRTAYRLGRAVRVDLHEAAGLIEVAEARQAASQESNVTFLP